MNSPMQKPPCLAAGYRTSENIATFLALAANVVLAWLVVKRSQKELHAFKRVLLLGCFVDSLFSITCNLFEIHVDIRHGVFVIVNNGPFVFDDVWSNHVVYSVYLYPVYFTISFVAVPMVFRYFLVCRNHILNGLQLALLFVVTAIPTALFSLSEALLWYPASEKTVAAWSSMLSNEDCYDRGLIPLFHYEEALKPSTFTPLLGAGSIVAGSYAVIIYCVLSIRRTLNSSKKLSNKTRMLQKQLDYAFIVQSLSPFVLIVVPIIGCILAVLGFEQLKPIARLCTSFLSWIAICNPISAMIFIKSYRRALVELGMRMVPRALHSRVYVASTTDSESQEQNRNNLAVTPQNATRPTSVGTGISFS